MNESTSLSQLPLARFAANGVYRVCVRQFLAKETHKKREKTTQQSADVGNDSVSANRLHK